MTASTESVRARRYLLGDVNSDESAALEQEFFEHPDTVDRISAVEEDLIEDYLGNQLTAADRDRFERWYLSAEHHRVRVDTIRRLMAKAAPASRRPLTGYRPWLALAASLLIVGSLVFWEFSPVGRKSTEVASGAPSPAPAVARPEGSQPAAGPRIFAVTVSPMTIRGGSDSAGIVIPTRTEVVALRLESDGEPRSLTPRRAVVRLVSGGDVWQGPATADADRSAGILARVEVPSVNLAANDYLLTLYGTDATGKEVEWTQYFLRVRGR
jgi:hypothetical protein